MQQKQGFKRFLYKKGLTVRVLLICAFCGLLCVSIGNAGLIKTPQNSNLDILGKVTMVEAYDVTLNRNATSFCMDLVEYKCYSAKFGYNVEKSRWVVGAGLDINGFAIELKDWTGWDLTVPILDQLGIKAVFLTTYSSEVIPNEPTWTFQMGASWNILKF